MEEGIKPPEQMVTPETREKGRNVQIVIKFLRHGERSKEGMLTDYGREVTRERAQQSGIRKEDYHVVRAVGSTADTPQDGMGRSLETADIYSHEIAGEDAFNTKIDDLLNYQTLLSPTPYNHRAIYNSHLPENFNDLPDEEKAKAAKIAQTATVNHSLSLTSPEAKAYRKEATGAYAVVIDHYVRLAKRLKSGSKVLIPAGTHGGLMELPLQSALVRVDKDGTRKLGLEKIEEIGGEIDPSEAFNVVVSTDQEGNRLPLKVTFDNPNRPQDEMFLDEDILSQSKDFYEGLHQESAS